MVDQFIKHLTEIGRVCLSIAAVVDGVRLARVVKQDDPFIVHFIFLQYLLRHRNVLDEAIEDIIHNYDILEGDTCAKCIGVDHFCC